ncbi:uncharacterized protein LOC142784408 isoform X2 [Rhipicephalus microplus]|uniref:uncharacterized protein LOC142784408 isoform X2 n=1 Tax=Rhipicephalus microplus TaxID=6941 RepID=UPI003F6A94B8
MMHAQQKCPDLRIPFVTSSYCYSPVDRAKKPPRSPMSTPTASLLLPVDAVGTANCLHHPVGNVYLSDATCCQDRIMHYSLYHKRIFFQIFNKSFFVDRKASLYRSIAVRQAREMFNKKLQLLVILGTYVCPQSIQPLFLPVEICQLCSCTAF